MAIGQDIEVWMLLTRVNQICNQHAINMVKTQTKQYDSDKNAQNKRIYILMPLTRTDRSETKMDRFGPTDVKI